MICPHCGSPNLRCESDHWVESIRCRMCSRVVIEKEVEQMALADEQSTRCTTKNKCAERDCNNVALRRGLCTKHFRQKYGFGVKERPDGRGLAKGWWLSKEKRKKPTRYEIVLEEMIVVLPSWDKTVEAAKALVDSGVPLAIRRKVE